MTKEIWKWTLEPINELEFPKDTKFLHADVQGGTMCIWGLVDPKEKQKEFRKLVVFGTGHLIPDEIVNRLKYISTILGMSPFVWHVFEVEDQK